MDVAERHRLNQNVGVFSDKKEHQQTKTPSSFVDADQRFRL